MENFQHKIAWRQRTEIESLVNIRIDWFPITKWIGFAWKSTRAHCIERCQNLIDNRNWNAANSLILVNAHGRARRSDGRSFPRYSTFKLCARAIIYTRHIAVFSIVILINEGENELHSDPNEIEQIVVTKHQTTTHTERLARWQHTGK